MKIRWPKNKKFAFSIFDDTDYTTLQNGPIIYDFLYRNNIITTKSVWVFNSNNKDRQNIGATCEDKEYLKWVLTLQSKNYEIAYHSTSFDRSKRERIIHGLDTFKSYFGDYPKTLAQHVDKIANEAIYWGVNRVSGINRLIYKTIMIMKAEHRNISQGELINSPYFWGDICKERIKYVRNFIYKDINTLKACPIMPYHDPDRPFVNYWFASTEAPEVNSFNSCLSEENQKKLEDEGGACIIYTHFGNNFVKNGILNLTFQRLITQLANRKGWFVPVTDLLDYLLEKKNNTVISGRERARLERKWLINKIRVGTS